MNTFVATVCLAPFMGLAVVAAESQTAPAGMIAIPGGSYKPLYAKDAKPRVVESFLMDAVQVTNGEFLEFVKKHPEWRRSKVSKTLADSNYLAHWAGDLDLGASHLRDAPVTNVSWFAAKAYCETHGRRLPTQDEWEFAARADATRTDASTDPEFVRELLAWYSRPASAPLPAASQGALNIYGLRGLHGVVWEWVDDFNSTMIVGDSRGDASPEQRLFCGAGSLLSADPGNYAAYMRYAFRSSLKGSYCVGSLGFRGARSAEEPSPAGLAAPAATLYDLPGEWRTQDDLPLAFKDFQGRPTLITMGFTSCKYACPRILNDMKRIESALGVDADRIRFVFLSFDVATDTPAKMRQSLSEYQLNPRRWTFAISSAETIRHTAVALNFKFESVDGFFAHSNLIALIDANGKLVHRTEALGAQIDPTVEMVRQLLRSQ
jgi:formylglycine-generating enzyme required for sulfatase activity